MNSRVRLKIAFLPVLLITVYTLLNMVSFCTSGKRELLNNYEDDAYYYFKIARQVVESGRSTFDGRTQTNGYHPLWMALLLPLSATVPDRFLFLRVLGVLSALACGGTAWVTCAHLSRRYSFIPVSLSASLMLTSFIAFGSTGMEVTLLMPLVTASLLLLLRMRAFTGATGESRGASRWLVLGILLSMVQLTRLDAVLLNLSLALLKEPS